MTIILYGFTHTTASGHLLRVEQYQEKDSIAILWRVIDNYRIIRQGLRRKPTKRQLEKYV